MSCTYKFSNDRIGLIACLSLLGACSSNGNTSSPISTPVATTPTTPTPVTPAPSTFDTAEFQNQPSLDQIGALAAYDAGGDGAGVIVGIIDSGIDVSNPEFAGRIRPESADLVISGIVAPADVRAGGPDLQDSDDHGTPIASIIGAARDNVGVHGVAPEVELLIYRADDETPDETLLGNAVVEGVTRSSTVGAGVLNFSFGSNEPGARGEFQLIFEFTRDNDIVVATAAGNDSNPEPDDSALGALDVTGDPTTIVVGSVDGNGDISGFSNQAGTAANIFLAAPGEFIQTTFVGAAAGDTRNFSGTSAAVPQVAGAAALIRQLWPALTASEVVDILFASATDLGATGIDTVYGRGLLNLDAAVAPLGTVTTTSVDGAVTSTDDLSASLSTVFGSSFADLPEIVVFDSYNRNFNVPLSDVVQTAAPDRFLLESAQNPFEHHAYAVRQISNGLTASFRLTSRDTALTDFEVHRSARLVGADWSSDYSDDILSMSLTQELPSGQEITVAQGFSASSTDTAALPIRQTPFLSHAFFNDAYLPRSENAVSSLFKMKLASNIDADFFASHTYGYDTQFANSIQNENEFRDRSVTTFRSGVNLDFDALQLRVEQGIRQEDGAILNALFDAPTSATTFYGGVDADWTVSKNWRLKGRYSTGYTLAETEGLGDFVDGFSGLTSTQISMAVARTNLFGAGDSLWLGVSKPLGIQSGTAEFILPTAYDYRTGEVSYTAFSAPLSAGSGRFDLEAGYRLMMGRLGSVDFNLIHQTFPGENVSSSTAFIARTGFEF